MEHNKLKRKIAFYAFLNRIHLIRKTNMVNIHPFLNLVVSVISCDIAQENVEIKIGFVTNHIVIKPYEHNVVKIT